ncbi:D-amino-acid transaminase [Bacillus shivajii]|uniref:D-amino-acid transaminase n=1 Tax=Bacillus shivajii TaxID=1983719 RepID=UPI001CFAF5BF|nr:D-amino-acid transaminase [Bacillus shivajii]UCZ52119.1 D-amino-acid transaminase [Bacillus shivajii]
MKRLILYEEVSLMKEIGFYQDRFVDINEKVVPIQERGHQFGDGIYEVIRVYNGELFTFDEHIDRLQMSAEAIDLEIPYSHEKIHSIVTEGLELSGIKEAEVYIQITRGIFNRQHHYPDGPAVFSMTIRHARKIEATARDKGIDTVVLDDERWLNCYIKSINLLPNVMAKQAAVKAGCTEAILHRDGIVTEGSSSNVFIVKKGILYTHPATKRILNGITRQKVIELANQQGIYVEEIQFDLHMLLEADEVFMTSTSMEVMPVKKIDNIEFTGEREITNKLISEFQKLLS